MAHKTPRGTQAATHEANAVVYVLQRRGIRPPPMVCAVHKPSKAYARVATWYLCYERQNNIFLPLRRLFKNRCGYVFAKKRVGILSSLPRSICLISCCRTTASPQAMFINSTKNNAKNQDAALIALCTNL